MIYIFSLWIYIWCLLYFMGIIKANPLYILVIATIFIIYVLSEIYKGNKNLYIIIKFIIINLLIKIILLIILVVKYPISVNKYDIKFGIIIFYIYLIITYLLDINPIKFYSSVAGLYIINHKDNETALGITNKLYDDIYNKLFKNINNR